MQERWELWRVPCVVLWCHTLNSPLTSASTHAHARMPTPMLSSAPSASRSTPPGILSRSTRASTTGNSRGMPEGSRGSWSVTRRTRDRCELLLLLLPLPLLLSCPARGGYKCHVVTLLCQKQFLYMCLHDAANDTIEPQIYVQMILSILTTDVKNKSPILLCKIILYM